MADVPSLLVTLACHWATVVDDVMLFAASAAGDKPWSVLTIN